ncbi:MAG: aldehyde ferredoxin oxidoreductase family protein [Firmicutes bacterium]|nr:aldehyde ferredoxin oxidoreductase family protein [Bacillota bacterium]
MPFGYCGKVLRVDLSSRKIEVEEPPERFYRMYCGGSGFVACYLLKETEPSVDPLGPENKLVFSAGVLTGQPLAGVGRHGVGARSPLTGGFGDSQAGGVWGTELKHAGFDAIVFEGSADHPVYLWVENGQASLRDARHLSGRSIGEGHASICDELGDKNVRIAQIGPSGEKLARFACIGHDLKAYAGRTGMGAVMGSKNLRAVAVSGDQAPQAADPQEVLRLSKLMAKHFRERALSLHELGTLRTIRSLNAGGGLPTRNFRQGHFEGMDRISGETVQTSLVTGKEGCFACPIRCKRRVQMDQPYHIDPAYGGPEYETVAAFGSNCGIDDLPAIAKANEICGAYGLDTISAGVAVGFAMECFEAGILSKAECDGLEPRFGDARTMLAMLQAIVERRGIGDLLAEGVRRAAAAIGRGAAKYAMHVKGQELPMHEPRLKQGLGLGYAVSPTGADHCHNMHDTLYGGETPDMEDMRSFGFLEPIPASDLGLRKARLFYYISNLKHFTNCGLVCYFIPWTPSQLVEMVGAVTGWNTSLFEIMRTGERAATLARCYNLREGFSAKDDTLPERFFTPFTTGPLAGVKVDRNDFEQARLAYYKLMGWDEAGVPSEAKLWELGVEWALDRAKRPSLVREACG